MTILLIAGLLLWGGVHLQTSLRTSLRASLIERIGANPYRGLVSLALLLAVSMIVIGWRGMSPAPLYQPPFFLRHLTMLLMPVAIILFTASALRTDVQRLVRHPQLIGLKTWALAHLLANGELRSLLLFGGLLTWAVITVILINRREAAWERPAAVGGAQTILHIMVGLLLTGILMLAHPWIAGVPLFSLD